MSSAEHDEEAGENAAVRRDLVSGSKLLERLAELISVLPPASGRADVVVAAPHHAPSHTPVSGGHDVETGPVALGLARALSGKCVIAHELRTFVDLNKPPHEQQAFLRHLGRVSFREADRQLKLYYQSQVFASAPATVIEVHGHVRGVFDIEVSAGFLLDERVPQDAALGSALREFKVTLERALRQAPAFSQSPPSVGVYPLDRDVKFAATGTYTFNKVERLRELGVNVAGLHIELASELRASPDVPGRRESHEQLVACLAEACGAFAAQNREPVAFDVKEQLIGEFLASKGNITPIGDGGFAVQPLPKEQLGRRVATFSPRDMERFGIGEGQSILLSSELDFGQTIEVRAAPAEKTRPGSIGIGKHLRSKLATKPGDSVYAGALAVAADCSATLGFVARISESCPQGVVQVGAAIAQTLAEKDLTRVLLRSPSGTECALSAELSNALPHARAVGLCVADAGQLAMTYGDLACLIAT